MACCYSCRVLCQRLLEILGHLTQNFLAGSRNPAQVVRAYVQHGDTSWNLPNMSSPFNRLYFMMDGEAYLENEDEKVPLVPGNMYLVPTGCRYSYICPSTMQKFYVHFVMELLPGVDLFSRLGRARELPCQYELLDRILENVGRESVSGLLYLKAVFAQIVYEFFECGTKDSDYLASFKGFYRQRAVLDYLAANLHAGLRIQDLAAAMDMPVHQLSRNFRQDTNLGLKEYMSWQLAQRARHLLLHTDMPIYEIAERLGFSDPYYFSRFFKKYESLSPRDYRKHQHSFV